MQASIERLLSLIAQGVILQLHLSCIIAAPFPVRGYPSGVEEKEAGLLALLLD